MSNSEKIVNDFFSTKESVEYYATPHLEDAESFLIRKFCQKGDKVFDVCCGGGRISIEVARKVSEVIGVDNNKSLVKAARKTLETKNIANVKFFLKDASDFIYRKNYFDCAFLFDTSLEHIPGKKKRVKVLQNIHASLKKNGILIVCLSSAFYPPKKLLRVLLFPAEEFGDSTHTVKFSHLRKTLFYHYFFPWEKKYFEKIGFRKITIIPNKAINRPILNAKEFYEAIKQLHFYAIFHNLFYSYYVFQKVD